MTYPDKQSNTIFIGVLRGYLKEIEEFLKASFSDHFESNVFQIEETGDLHFAGGKRKDYAGKPTITAENVGYQSTPGQMLPKIQCGKTIETKAISADVGGKIATLGGITRDQKSGKLYGITAQHAFLNMETGFKSGNCDTFCSFETNSNSPL